MTDFKIKLINLLSENESFQEFLIRKNKKRDYSFNLSKAKGSRNKDFYPAQIRSDKYISFIETKSILKNISKRSVPKSRISREIVSLKDSIERFYESPNKPIIRLKNIDIHVSNKLNTSKKITPFRYLNL